VLVTTVGHGTRPLEELVRILQEAQVTSLVDVRRYPASRRNPQFNGPSVEAAVTAARIEYRHEVELGGRRSGEPGEELFACLRVAAFRSYAARMAAPEWQAALERALDTARPCFMCAETLWWRCHRRLIAELLTAEGHEVVHLMAPGETQPHRLYPESEIRDGRLTICGQPVRERPSDVKRLLQETRLFGEGTE
jgi:uncharacterized protein (DUF488 family)